jgi:hypothetical protein
MFSGVMGMSVFWSTVSTLEVKAFNISQDILCAGALLAYLFLAGGNPVSKVSAI